MTDNRTTKERVKSIIRDLCLNRVTSIDPIRGAFQSVKEIMDLVGEKDKTIMTLQESCLNCETVEAKDKRITELAKVIYQEGKHNGNGECYKDCAFVVYATVCGEKECQYEKGNAKQIAKAILDKGYVKISDLEVDKTVLHRIMFHAKKFLCNFGGSHKCQIADWIMKEINLDTSIIKVSEPKKGE